MPRETHLQRRAGRYVFRARVPQDLVGVTVRTAAGLKTFGQEIRRALGTADPREAKRRKRIVAVEVEREFERARAAVKTKTALQPVSPDDLRRMVATWFHGREAAAHDRELAHPVHAEHVYDLQVEAAMLADPEDECIGPSVQQFGLEIAQQAGLEIARGSPVHMQLAELARRAALEAVNRALARARGDYSGKAHDSLFAGPHHNHHSPADGPTVEGLFDQYKAHHKQMVVPNVARVVGARLDLFTRIIGAHTQARAVDRKEARRVFEVVCQLPTRTEHRFPPGSIEHIIQQTQARHLPTMAPATVNQYMATIGAAWRFALAETLVTINPWLELEMHDPVKAKHKRRGYTAEELSLLFHGPLYPAGPVTNSLAWIPLICLHQGTRLGEACGLAVADVRKIGGVDVLVLQPDPTVNRTLKNEGTERTIPIHPGLVRLGFLDHVERQRRAGERRLFPDLPRGQDGKFTLVSKWLAEHVETAGPGARDNHDKRFKRLAPTHSLRHTWTTRAREAGLPRDRRNAVGGWNNAWVGMSDTYGDDLAAQTLLADASKITFPVDLSHLYP